MGMVLVLKIIIQLLLVLGVFNGLNGHCYDVTECTETDIVADVIDDLVSKFGTDRIEERIKYIKENGMRAGE